MGRMKIFVGQPATHSDMANHREGFVAAIENAGRILIVFPEECATASIPFGIAERWIEEALSSHRSPTTASTCKWLVEDAAKAQRGRMEARKARQEQMQRDTAAFRVALTARIPEGFKGAIVAERHEDVSDSMTDYFAHKTTRRVVLGFTKSARNLFGNMRKGAATFDRTAHLVESGSAFEHRENYSMGAGTYLKAGSSNASGWSVRIETIEYGIRLAEFGPECPGAPKAAACDVPEPTPALLPGVDSQNVVEPAPEPTPALTPRFLP